MIRCVLTLTLAVTLAACGQTGQNNTQPEITESAWSTGQRAYEDACAGCHEEGLFDAPRTGDREAWAGRSWLWEAVLFEHARDGFGQMPAKGGDTAMDDATVTKAAEYMLTVTYPETHRD